MAADDSAGGRLKENRRVFCGKTQIIGKCFDREKLMSLENRLTAVEQAVIELKTLVISHDDRLEDYYKALEESRRDFEFKMNALIDSQIRTEAEIRELKETSKSTLERLDRLERKNGNK
jgi:predicted RNase H-like nuclease (RuvC/YqgF family)